MEVAWVGYWGDLTSWAVGLNDSGTAWLSDWLGVLENSEAVLVQSVIHSLGRLGCVVAAADELKPFVGPFYEW